MDKEKTYPISIRVTAQEEKMIRDNFVTIADFFKFAMDNFIAPKELILKKIEEHKQEIKRLEEAINNKTEIKDNIPFIECVWLEMANQRIINDPYAFVGNLEGYKKIFRKKNITEKTFKRLLEEGSLIAQKMDIIEKEKTKSKLMERINDISTEIKN